VALRLSGFQDRIIDFSRVFSADHPLTVEDGFGVGRQSFADKKGKDCRPTKA
jgi:hypothetical protein